MTDLTPTQKAETLWEEFATKVRYERIAATHGQSRPDIPLSSVTVLRAYQRSLRKDIEKEIAAFEEILNTISNHPTSRIEIEYKTTCEAQLGKCRWFLQLIDNTLPND